MSDQHGSDEQTSNQHTREGQVQRAKRLREQIESLKSGRSIDPLAGDPPAGQGKSLREQVEDRANRVRERDESSGSA
jgi:hypothetical protein